MNRDDVRWRVENYREGDNLTDETVDEAVEDYLDDLESRDEERRVGDLEQELRDLGVITVECWVRETVEARTSWAENTLLEFLSRHFDEQMNPDGDTDAHVTPAMLEAAKRFVDAVVSEFVPWSMRVDKARNVQIDALLWVRENRPNWLKGGV